MPSTRTLLATPNDLLRRIPGPTQVAAAVRRGAPARRTRPSGILLGHGKDGPFTVPDAVRFETHTQILGPTGRGKSFLMLSMAIQDIAAGRSVCIIDPAGTLYLAVLNHLLQRGVDPSRIVAVNPLRLDFSLRMNPLQGRAGQPGTGTDLSMSALCRVANETDYSRTPRLRKYVRACVYPLECAAEPLSLLPFFASLSPRGRAFRFEITKQVPDEVVRLIWEEFNAFPRSTQAEHLDSTLNRVSQFCDDARIRRMMTFAAGNISWDEVLAQGAIVLVNLGNVGGQPISAEAKRLLGSLIIYGLVTAALRRSGPEPRMVVYCDEFGSFVSEDIADGLDQCRKFGVHFVLAHQRYEQIQLESPNVMSAIDDNCGIKICFGGLSRLAAERAAREVFTGSLDLDAVKYAYSSVAFRPILRWVDIVSRAAGGATTIGGSETHSTSTTQSTSTANSRSVIYTLDGLAVPTASGVTYTDNYAEALAETTGNSSARTWAESSSWQESVSRVPITEHEPFLQPEQRQFRTVEELWEQKIALLKRLPKRAIVAAVPGCDEAVVLTTPDVLETAAHPDELATYETEALAHCPYAVPAAAAEAEFQRKLLQYHLAGAPPDEPDAFATPVAGLPGPAAAPSLDPEPAEPEEFNGRTADPEPPRQPRRPARRRQRQAETAPA